jgi:carboxymethylenebutenolidase
LRVGKQFADVQCYSGRVLRYGLALLLIVLAGTEIVSFRSGDLTLRGVLYKPEGSGPFPAVLYNHGSGRDYAKQFETLGPVFAQRGWIFFAPYRRGQGLSASAGPYIVDEMDEAEKAGGPAARSATMVRLLETDHLNDQLAALAWLKKSPLVKANRVAVAGNSFGGIQTILGAERGEYCAAIDSAGAAQTWSSSPEIQALMIRSVRNARAPIFFFQAENDWDLSPSRTLAAVAESAEKIYQIKIYPPFGESKEDGHSFGYFGSSVWADDVFKFLNEHCAK